MPLTKPYFNRFRARLETLRQSAAPPSAAAQQQEQAAPPSAPVGVEAIREAFDEISGLCRHLRQGGPAPEDLQDLSDALDEAVGIAANMLHALAQQPAAVDGATIPAWRVMPFTGSWKACDERWEVYSPDGSGGVVLASEVRSRDVADLLDALAAQHQEPKS